MNLYHASALGLHTDLSIEKLLSPVDEGNAIRLSTRKYN